MSGAIEATPILRVRAHSARGQEAAERHAGSALVWPLHRRPFVPRDTTDLLRFVQGCTFDDFLLTPQLGIVPSRDPAVIDLTTRYTAGITLRRPVVSANMDTITRSAMAVALAEEGGIGVIDRGFRAGDIAPRIVEVTAVKRTQHGIIADPHTIGADQRIADARQLMERTGVGTLVVPTADRRLAGLLTRRDVRFVSGDAL